MPALRPLLRRLYYKHGPHHHLLNRRKLASAYLHGKGIEIGALDQPLPVPRRATVTYVDRMTKDELRQHHPEMKGLWLAPVNLVTGGETLAALPDGSQDFVIANHFIEHCQNSIQALVNHFRVLKTGGCLFMATPDKRYTFDRRREITSLLHLWHDYEGNPDWTKHQHFEDFVRGTHAFHNGTNHNGTKSEEELNADVEHLLEQDYSIHYHV